MTLTMRSTLHRPLALGAAAALLAALAVAEVGAPASADESPLPGIELPVPATDVTETDTTLGSAAREVVVVVTGDDGPEVRKLRAATQADADRLARELASQDGVEAAVNRVAEIAPNPVRLGTEAGKDSGALPVADPASKGLAWVGALAAEPQGANQWGLAVIGAEQAWDVTRGSGVLVAVVDSGVDGSHPDLAGRVRPQIDVVADGVTGDVAGHGTHVAGIIAASLDGAGVTGLANQVEVLPVRVADRYGRMDIYTTAQGIYSAVDSGAKVINLSLGGSYYSSVEHSAVQYAVDRGVTVVASGGNDYADGNPVQYPAAIPGVLGVSSLNSAGKSSWFANTGSYIDITAPGEGILSTVPGGLAYKDGTSMAAPFVSAAAGLVRVANPTLTKAQVDTILLSTALDDSLGDGRDDVFGYGLLRADSATEVAARTAGGLRADADGDGTPDVNDTCPSVPGPAGTSGCPQPAPTAQPAPVLPVPAVTVRATSGRSKLYVDVNPNKGSGYWTFQVQRQRADGSWKPLKTYRTTGSKETRTLNLPKGTYRVVVNAKYGHQASISTPAYLKR